MIRTIEKTFEIGSEHHLMERDYRQFDTLQTMSGFLIPVWMCPDDGAMVLDTSLHDRWHDWIDTHGIIGAVWSLRDRHDRRPI